MVRLTSCHVHHAVTLPWQALKRSQISFLLLKPLGRYLTPGKSTCTLNHSFCTDPHTYCNAWGVCRKTSHIHFFQGSSFRMPIALTMLHSFHLRITIGFGSPHHILSILSLLGDFRFSGYAFTTLCTIHRYSGVTHSGVLALVLSPTLTCRAWPCWSLTILILHGRGI